MHVEGMLVWKKWKMEGHLLNDLEHLVNAPFQPSFVPAYQGTSARAGAALINQILVLPVGQGQNLKS